MLQWQHKETTISRHMITQLLVCDMPHVVWPQLTLDFLAEDTYYALMGPMSDLFIMLKIMPV